MTDNTFSFKKFQYRARIKHFLRIIDKASHGEYADGSVSTSETSPISIVSLAYDAANLNPVTR